MFSRVEFTSSRTENGQLLVSGKGLAGEQFEDALYLQPHGAASNPPAGSKGFLLSMPGRRTQAIILGVEHPGNRPELTAGAAALYDASGNIIKLFAGGVVMDFGSRTITMTGGAWNITGDVTIDGTLHVTGDITSDAPDGADE